MVKEHVRKYLCENRLELGSFPTPIQLLNLSKEVGGDYGIYIKRDDLTGIGLGGNKIRFLEYLLYEAKKKGSDIVIASGPNQSNLCMLTAACCNRMGMDCQVVVNSERPNIQTGNELLNKLMDVPREYLGPVSEEERAAFVDDLAASLKHAGRRPYIIRNGASSGLGAMGYVNAAYEIYEQNKALDYGIQHIFAPGANGGVAAGLILGNYLLGCPFTIHVISVEYDLEKMNDCIQGVILESQELLGIEPKEIYDGVVMYEEFRGSGWGEDTVESRAEVSSFAKREGIFIENIYTSKTVVGMEAVIRRGELRGNAIYIHTGGLGALFSQYE
ncbi:MAG: pyridoxal-phosphate dependent enzyme [Tissierellia bacterium]|nr:pyridoxal-phosphate dependent enzyme [Tissierellia bacterium]